MCKWPYKDIDRERGSELPVPGGMQTDTDCPVFRDAAEVISTSLRGYLASLLSPENLSERGV